ncbi:adenosine receptor A3-like [Oculina patagonica]
MSTNFTKDEIYEIIQALACTPSQYGNHFIHSLAAINIILAITATLGNALILAALRKSSSLHPPSKLMFQCLAVTDLCVGVLAQPVFVIQLISTTYEQPHLCFAVVSINEIAGSSFSGVSLLTLTAISVDRLLALRLGLRYRQTVTLRRTRFVVIFIWIFNISTNSLRRFWHYFLISRVISVVIYSSLAISAFCYLKIYVTLRQHYAVQDIVQQGQSNQGRTNPLNIARYRRTVSTALYVQFALVACYLPYGVVVAIALAGGYLPSFNLAVRLTITLVLLNSSLNPILYCWKINGVRQAVRDMVTHPCSFFSSS